MVTNLSSVALTPAQDSLLSRGLNFCPDPGKVNWTEMEARYARFSRVTRWRELWHGKLEGEKIGPKNIFKEIKTNYPPGGCPKNLQLFLQSLHDDMMHAPLNHVHSNLPVSEKEGGEQLVAA